MRRLSGRHLSWITLVLGGVLYYGCGGGGGAGPAEVAAPAAGVGRVAILLTDAPTEAFDEVNVTIAAVHLLADEERVQLFESALGVTRNLLDLRDSAELLFNVTDAPTGCYDKIRLVVTGVELVRYARNGDQVLYDDEVDGVLVPRIADGFPAQAHLSSNKIDLNPRGSFCVVAGETLVLQVDMDVLRSVHVVENAHGTEFNFRPVVFVTVLAGEELGRLVRLNGWVEEVTEAGFTLCRDWHDGMAPLDWAVGACTQVVLEETSLFDATGSSVEIPTGQTLPDVLAAGDYVTVVGRYTAVVEAARTAAHQGHDHDDMDEEDHVLRRLLAEVVEIGSGPNSWRRYRGEITEGGELDGGCVGVFRLLLDQGQGIAGDLELPVHLFAGTRLFAPTGEDLGCDALEVGRRATVDAVLHLAAGEDDILKAALVMIEPMVVEPETRIEATLTMVGEDGTLWVERGDPGEALCANLRPGVIALLHVPAEGTLGDIVLGSEHEGLPISLFGEWRDGMECFSVGAGVVTGPVPEPDPPAET